MILEIYTVVALLCDKRNDCVQRTVWTGRDRTECMAQAVQVRVNPPSYVNETKMSACLVERVKDGFEWAPQGFWRKVKIQD
jgi:hypothetical protein